MTNDPLYNSDDNKQLRLLGITYNQIESGVYALILEEMDGNRRIPIVIGYAEAQAIECKLQEVVTPRPLTHDLMVSILQAFGATLKKITIRRLPTGVFASTLHLLTRDGELKLIDSRSSDAVALAIRVGAPIFTSAAVLDEAGFSPSDAELRKRRDNRPKEYAASTDEMATSGSSGPYEEMSDAQLLDLLNDAVSKEKYEIAQQIKKILDSRKK
ncbi:MAG: bifunctional nuclease family protein [Muribaculum sp.]|nr:bifunctional nuclease family protein [Muribaculum sp.]